MSSNKKKNPSSPSPSANVTPTNKGTKSREKRERTSPGESSTPKTIRVLNHDTTIEEEIESDSDTRITPGLLRLINTIVEKATAPLLNIINAQRETIEKISTTLEQFMIETTKMKEIDELSNRASELQIKFDEQHDCLLNHENRLNKAELYIDELEQYSRRGSLRFKNVPLDHIPRRKTRGDRTILDTDSYVMNIANNILKTNITMTDIDRSHLTGKPDSRGRVTILCKFTNYKAKSSVYYSKRSLKNSREGIFIVEDLTKYRVRMIGKLNDLYRNKIVANFWTADGRIFYKTASTSVPEIAKSLDQLINTFPQDY